MYIVGQLFELVPFEPRALKPFDILDVFTTLEIRVNESVKISVLKLDRSTNIEPIKRSTYFIDNSFSMSDTSVVVVC